MMKKLSAAILVIFIVLLTTQFVRHAYNRVFYTQESVLDRYDKKKGDLSIDKTLSLKELSMIYADAEKRIRVYESGKSGKKLEQYDGSGDPYAKKAAIESLIRNIESDHRITGEIIFHWAAGLILIACGSLVFLKFNQWIGTALVISGLTTMTWKTGPLFFMAGSAQDSPFILNIKLIFTFITLAGFIAYWYFTGKYHDK